MATASEERQDMTTEVALLKNEVESVNKRLENLDASHENLARSISALNKSWDQASGALNFIKWMVSAIAVITAMIAAIKAFGAHPS